MRRRGGGEAEKVGWWEAGRPGSWEGEKVGRSEAGRPGGWEGGKVGRSEAVTRSLRCESTSFEECPQPR